MSTPTGKITKQSTGQPIQHHIGGSDVGGEASERVQKTWTDNIEDLRTAFCNGFGRSPNKFWEGGKNNAFRLDLQSSSGGEERFAFQEDKAVHGQVHLRIPGDAKIQVPEIADEQERKKWTKEQQVNWSIGWWLVEAMIKSLKDGTIWEVYYEPPQQAQGQGNNKKK